MEQVLTSLPVTQPFANRVLGTPYVQTAEQLQTLQINVGLRCNLACTHCHLYCSPARSEMMSLETMRHCLRVAQSNGIKRLDITGGAPELNPHVPTLIMEASDAGMHIMFRSNLAVWDDEDYSAFPEFLAKHNVEVIASLPCYTQDNTDEQRGDGVFGKIISSLRRLNALGYGLKPELLLNLVYNPGGAFLPPPQEDLESDYKKILLEQYGIVFNKLFTLTINPSGRFAQFLEQSGELKEYMQCLELGFNADTLPMIMCRTQMSVAWDGTLYDCDFNLALGLRANVRENIADIKGSVPVHDIRFSDHCYGCTAGSGSSCGGVVV